MRKFQLNRVDLRRRMAQDYGQEDFTAAQWLGGATRWLANIPLMYQALVAPMAGREFVRPPRRDEDFLDSNRFACWGSLLHLLTMSFGWRYPALGMRWWVNQGRPTEDDRFALISQTWAADGQFDAFLAYFWRIPSIAWPAFSLGPGYPDVYAEGSRVPDSEPLADRDWIADTLTKFKGLAVGGLHLEQGHIHDWLVASDSMNQAGECVLTLDAPRSSTSSTRSRSSSMTSRGPWGSGI